LRVEPTLETDDLSGDNSMARVGGTLWRSCLGDDDATARAAAGLRRRAVFRPRVCAGIVNTPPAAAARLRRTASHGRTFSVSCIILCTAYAESEPVATATQHHCIADSAPMGGSKPKYSGG